MPQPGPGEVLVAVQYAALNRLDNFVRIGWKGLDLALPHILGSDFSGAIAALGAGRDRVGRRAARGGEPDPVVRAVRAVPRRPA